MKLKHTVWVISTFFLVGCGANVQQIEVSATPIERSTLIVPEADNLILKDIQWYIINKGVDSTDPHSIEFLWAELEKKYGSKTLIAVTSIGFQDLVENLAKLQQLVIQQQAIIEAYKQYYNTQIETTEE